jgi:hypothetical protein
MPSQIAESLKLPISWLYGPNRPLYEFSGLASMTVFYIVLISVLSFLMRNRRATENKINRQAGELKKLEKEAASNETIKEKYEALKKEHDEAKAHYKPFNINFITLPHNLFMCIYSLYAFVGVLAVMIENNKTASSLTTLICDPNEEQQRDMDYWFYTFYLSKYVEYIDTVFLIIKAKGIMPPANSQYFLHIYHHAVTAAIVWACMHYNFSTSWTGPLTNAFVHILMYGYYFLAEANLIDRRLGGKFITPIQLIQFVFCLVLAIIETVWNLVTNGGCNSDYSVIIFMFVNYGIFFIFFVKVYLDKKNERTRGGGSSE